MTLEEAAALSEAGTLGERLLSLDMPLAHLPRLEAAPGLRRAVANGAKLPLRALRGDMPPEGQPVRIYLEGMFWGMAVREGEQMVWRALIAPEG